MEFQFKLITLRAPRKYYVDSRASDLRNNLHWTYSIFCTSSEVLRKIGPFFLLLERSM